MSGSGGQRLACVQTHDPSRCLEERRLAAFGRYEERKRAMMDRRQVIAAGAAAAAAWPFGDIRAGGGADRRKRVHRVGLSGRGNGRSLVPSAERKAARALRNQRPGRQPGGCRRTAGRGIRQARQPGRADHSANSGVDHDVVSAHLQIAELRSARRFHSGDLAVHLHVLLHRQRGSAGGDPNRRRFRRPGRAPTRSNRPTAYQRRAHRCILPA